MVFGPVLQGALAKEEDQSEQERWELFCRKRIPMAKILLPPPFIY